MHTLLVFIFPFISLGVALQAASFNVSSETASRYGCGAMCHQQLSSDLRKDVEDLAADFDFEFYETAANFSQSQPGDVLKFQALDPAHLGVHAGTTVYRLQYTSKDLDGSIVPATGFIALPYAPTVVRTATSRKHCFQDKAQYRLIAYAHGTSGLYRGCAPSNGPVLYDYNSWQLLVGRGYAVVATDYAGLGNSYATHKYFSFPAHANDVYYSVVAARKLFGDVLSKKWMSIGHSQGGGAVWKLAESDFVNNKDGQPINDYIGTVALAPAIRIADLILSNANRFPSTAYIPHLALGLQRYMPSYNLTMLGAGLRRRVPLMELGQLCNSAMKGLTSDLPYQDAISLAGVEQDKRYLLEWQNKTAPASGGRSTSPILLMQGLSDTAALPSAAREGYNISCSAGNEVDFRQYHGLEHSPLLPATAPEWLAWANDRFTGHATNGKCSVVTRRPFDPFHVKVF